MPRYAKDTLNELMKDPDFAKEWESMEPEFQIIKKARGGARPPKFRFQIKVFDPHAASAELRAVAVRDHCVSLYVLFFIGKHKTVQVR